MNKKDKEPLFTKPKAGKLSPTRASIPVSFSMELRVAKGHDQAMRKRQRLPIVK